MTLSVILVSYNNKDVLHDCLDSIYRFNDIGNELEVIVVEQSPGNEIFETFRTMYPWVKFIRNDNVGFGGGNNKGAESANGKYLLFLNTDTLLLEPIFGWAVDVFNNHDRVGAFGCKLVDAHNKTSLSFAMNFPFQRYSSFKTKIRNYLSLFDQRQMYISGADIFIRKDLFDKTGGFDRNIFMYLEDTLLCMNVRNMGYQVKYYPQKRIVHLQGGSSTNKNVISSRRYLSSYRYFCEIYKIDYEQSIREYIKTLQTEIKIFGRIFPSKAAPKKQLTEELEEELRRNNE